MWGSAPWGKQREWWEHPLELWGPHGSCILQTQHRQIQPRLQIALKSPVAPRWGGTHPLKQEADGLDLSKGRGPDEWGKATLVRLVDEVVTWQEEVVPLDCTPAHSPQHWGSGDGVVIWGQTRGEHMYGCINMAMLVDTGTHVDTHRSCQHISIHKVRQAQIHQHTGMDTHLSSDAPLAGSALLVLRAGGWTGLGPERGRVFTCPTLALCLSVPRPKLLSALPPCYPSPTLGMGATHSPEWLAGLRLHSPAAGW